MRNSPDPPIHREREKHVIEHVESLLDDPRLRVETTGGPKPVAGVIRDVEKLDQAVELKRLMADLGKPDRELEARMPIGASIVVTLLQKRLLIIPKTIGRLCVVCVSPGRELVMGEEAPPLSLADLQKHPVVSALRALAKKGMDVPTTLVIASTSGFAPDARELAYRRDGLTTILLEPNDAGGWNLQGPPSAKPLMDVLNPEGRTERRRRVFAHVQSQREALFGGSLSAPRVAAKLQLPLPTVEAELKSYALENPGFAAGRIDGQVLLYRVGSASAPPEEAARAAAYATGDSPMPFWQKVKGIFKHEASRAEKIARLSAERAGLVVQRERAYEEIAVVEKKEADLTASFEGASALAQRRIATEVAQLRVGIERRQQVLATLDKKINIVDTGIHTLEMEQHLNPAKLAALEEAAKGSELVDTGIATLEQLDEAASAAGVGHTDLSQGAQDVLDELRAKYADAKEADEPAAAAASRPQRAAERPAAPPREPAPRAEERRRGEAEAS